MASTMNSLSNTDEVHGAEQAATAAAAAAASTSGQYQAPPSDKTQDSQPVLAPHRGELVQLPGLKCYVVRPTTAAATTVDTGSAGDNSALTSSSRAALLVAHDAFGIDSGRTRRICDQLCDDLGVLVICSDFWHYHGNDDNNDVGGDGAGAAALVNRALMKSSTKWEKLTGLVSAPKFLYGIATRNWDAVSADYHRDVLPFLTEKENVTRLAALGFSWGGWLVLHASGMAGHTGEGGELSSNHLELCCGVSMHPSLSECKLLRENVQELCRAVRCPQMVLSAKNDPQVVKPGGLMNQILSEKPFRDQCVFECFSDMYHGWTHRGDMEDPRVIRDASRALILAKAFLKKHLFNTETKHLQHAD